MKVREKETKTMKRIVQGVFALFMLATLVLTGCAGSGTGKVQAGGCEPVAAVAAKPAAVVAPVVTAATVQKEIIYFDFDKSNIRASEQPKITKVIGWMKDPKANAIVIGYTDPIGTDAYNMKLSKTRAESVKAALVKGGVPADKIKLEWKGETNLAKPGMKGIPANAPNRRSEVEVTVK
jgi:OmpA-OmpF porin, OOP family